MTTRLPVQHPTKPHCPKCAADLPNFNDMRLDVPASVYEKVTLLAVIYCVRCKCGAEWRLEKGIKQ